MAMGLFLKPYDTTYGGGMQQGRKPIEQQRILAEERKVLSTYRDHAQANADDDLGGRFGTIREKPKVIGVSPITYPRLPSGPWASNEMPDEPCLGYSVEEMEPTGEIHEQRRQEAADQGNGPSTSSMRAVARPK